MTWLDRLRRLTGGPVRPGGGPEAPAPRLRAEAVGHYARGRYAEAVEAAGRLVDWQRQALGPAHPGYARALTLLALLLRKTGDGAAAARRLAQAVDVRRAALGPDHPETAEAESLLADLWVHPSPPAASNAAVTAAEPPVLPALAGEVALLAEVFADLGERVSEAARGLVARGAPPLEDLDDEVAFCRRQFDALLARAQRLGLPGTPGTPGGPPPSLHALARWLRVVPTSQVSALAGAAAASDGDRAAALEAVDRVLALTARAPAAAPALDACQRRALCLREAARAGAADPGELDRLAAGDHPFAALLDLAERRDALPGVIWASRYEAVAAAFGPALARAACSGRVVTGRPAGSAA